MNFMQKKNCWEFKKCGRDSGGKNASELGICPASLEEKANGIHDGINGGRACWVIAGTFCKDKVQGTYASKVLDCIECDFYNQVSYEEGNLRIDSIEIIFKLRK
jgi:hypothetical protein